jgi:hypothetical protein
VAVVVALVIMAGCGTAGDDASMRDVDRIMGALVTAGEVASGSSADSRAVVRLAGQVDTAANRLRALGPPEEVQDELDALVITLAGVANDMRQLAKVVDDGDRAEASVATDVLLDSFERIVEDESALKAAFDAQA